MDRRPGHQAEHQYWRLKRGELSAGGCFLVELQDGRTRWEQRQLVLIARVVVDGATGVLPMDGELRT